LAKDIDEHGVNRVIAAIQQTWVVPELRRRIEEGHLAEGFKLRAFQVITDDDGRPSEVRLNDEVRAAVRIRSRREKSMDDVVFGDDTVEVPELLLTADDPNAAHITGVETEGGWLYSIDLRRNSTEAARHGSAAREFLDAAGMSLVRGNTRAFVDNLFSATELIAKAYLLTRPAGHKPGRHGWTATSFNLDRKEGKVSESFTGLLNRLAGLRKSARYLEGELKLDAAEANKMMATAEEMFRALYDVVPKRYERRSR
jgi:uncharacterized protein (UPF0332 family)